jgi:hypothetical protein
MSRKLIWLAPLLLAACGVVPLPEQTQPDFYFRTDADPQQFSPGTVAYLPDNQVQSLNVPNLPYQRISMNAELTAMGYAPALSERYRLEIFVIDHRPDCPVVSSDIDPAESSLVCDGPAGGQALSEVVLKRDVAVPIRLEGAILDRAVKQRQLYLGVRLLEGQLRLGDYVKVSQIRINGRL